MVKLNVNGVEVGNDELVFLPERGILPETENAVTQIGERDGSIFLSSRLKERIIPIKFVVKTMNRRNFEISMSAILHSKEPVPLIFSDRPDEVWNGLVDGEIDLDRAFTIGKGTIKWLVPDGHSYSKTEKTATNNGTAKTISFTNNGTDSTPVNVTAEMVGDNGFVGLTLNGRPYQVGIAQQVDGVKYDDAEVLYPGSPQADPNKVGEVNKPNFNTVPGKQWLPYKQGAISIHNWAPDPLNPLLFPDSYGTAPAERHPVECTATYKIPKDKTTSTEGAKNFTFRAQFGFHSYNPFDSGQICMTVHKKNGEALAQLLLNDLYVGKEDYKIQFWANDSLLKEYASSKVNGDYNNYAIIKYGSQITFRSQFGDRTYNIASLADEEAYYVSFSFLKWFPYETPKIYEIKNWNFWEGYVDLFHDEPNYFKKNDVLLIDSEANEVYINGQRTQDAVDIGSQPLLAVPGENTLGIVKSDWAKMPKVNIEYRERWL